MIDIQDFVEINYGYRPAKMWTLEMFSDFKTNNGFEEWDYPLEEYAHITEVEKESGIKFMPVRFHTCDDGYEYRFCELREK